MKNLRFLLCLLVVIAASAFVFTACGNGDGTTAPTTTAATTTAATTVIDYSERTVTPAAAIAEDLIKVHGRYVELADEAISCDFTACGIEFAAYCRGEVTVDLSVYKPNFGSTSASTDYGYFTVWVDGERVEVDTRGTTDTVCGIKVSGKNATLTLATDLEEGYHTFKLLKQNSARNCIAQINSIGFTGEFAERPADSDVYIEFYGDSLTAGYGNLGTPSVGDGGTDYEDGTQTYAYLAATELGADFSIVARSGIGVAYGSDDLASQMSNIFKYQCYWRHPKEKHDFARQADLVVLYLGTNDDNQGPKQSPTWLSTFETKYRAMIDELIEYHGEEVEILLLENRAVSTGMKNVFASIDADYEQVRILPFTRHLGGAKSHPNVSEHETEAAELVAALRETYPELFPAK